MRGKGYGREAVALLTDWLFEHASAQLVEAGTEIGREWLMYRITRQQWQAARG